MEGGRVRGGGQLNAVCALLAGGGVFCGRGRAGRDWQVVVVQQGGGAVFFFANGTTGSGRGRYCTRDGWRAWRPDAGQAHHQSCQGGGGAALYRPLSFVRHPCHGKTVFTTATLFFQDSMDAAWRRQLAVVAPPDMERPRLGRAFRVQNGGPGARWDPHLALSSCTQPRMRMARRGCTCSCWWSVACGGPVAALSPWGTPPTADHGGRTLCAIFCACAREIEGRGDVTPGRRLQGGDGAPSDMRVGPARPRSSGAAAGRRPTSVALYFQDGRVHTKDALSTAVLSCGCRVLQMGGSGGD